MTHPERDAHGFWLFHCVICGEPSYGFPDEMLCSPECDNKWKERQGVKA